MTDPTEQEVTWALEFVDSGGAARIAVDPDNACGGQVCFNLARALRQRDERIKNLEAQKVPTITADARLWLMESELRMKAEASVNVLEAELEKFRDDWDQYQKDIGCPGAGRCPMFSTSQDVANLRLAAEVASLKARNKELEAEIEGCPINDALMRLEKAEVEMQRLRGESRPGAPEREAYLVAGFITLRAELAQAKKDALDKSVEESIRLGGEISKWRDYATEQRPRAEKAESERDSALKRVKELEEKLKRYEDYGEGA